MGTRGSWVSVITIPGKVVKISESFGVSVLAMNDSVKDHLWKTLVSRSNGISCYLLEALGANASSWDHESLEQRVRKIDTIWRVFRAVSLPLANFNCFAHAKQFFLIFEFGTEVQLIVFSTWLPVSSDFLLIVQWCYCKCLVFVLKIHRQAVRQGTLSCEDSEGVRHLVIWTFITLTSISNIESAICSLVGLTQTKAEKVATCVLRESGREDVVTKPVVCPALSAK